MARTAAANAFIESVSVMTEATVEPWLVRPFSAETDKDALLYMLGVGYTRSRAGNRAGANRAGYRNKTPDQEAVAREKSFLEAHRPMWLWLLENGDVSLAVDSEAPKIIWAWLVTSRPNIVHAVGCKRSLIEEHPTIARELVGEMLGDERLKAHQVCSLELPQMRTRGLEAIGIDRPKEWSLDPTWLLTRMGMR